jgi:DNA-binding transcriptional LysR family regulator
VDQLTAMKVFRAVAELGSFAGASRHLNLSPAAVSKNITELEAHLGLRLLNRTTRRLSRTEAGARYYEHVVLILDQMEEAEASLGAMQYEPRGLLRVTAPLTLTLTLFSAAVPRFLERFPQLSLDLRLDDRRINIVEEGFDIAIRVSGHLDDSSLVARRLANLQYVVCCSPSYLERFGRPSTPEDLQQHSCVRFTLSDRVDEWEFRKGDRLARVAVAGRYRVSSSLAVRDALLAGFGLSLVPRIYVADHLRRGQLTAVLEDWSAAETSVYALYPSKRHMTAKTNAFLAFLAEQLDP